MQGQEFPTAFDSHIRKIHRLLFHVLAHVYHAHFREIVLLQLHAHLNAIFAHFIELNLRFNTVEEKVSRNSVICATLNMVYMLRSDLE